MAKCVRPSKSLQPSCNILQLYPLLPSGWYLLTHSTGYSLVFYNCSNKLYHAFINILILIVYIDVLKVSTCCCIVWSYEFFLLLLLYLRHNNVFSYPIATEPPSFTISQLSTATQAYFNLGIPAATRKAYIQLASTKTAHYAGRLTSHLYQFVNIHCCRLSQIWPSKIYPTQWYKCTSLQYNTVTSQLVTLLF